MPYSILIAEDDAPIAELIKLSLQAGWIPRRGGKPFRFCRTFDGNGHTISSLIMITGQGSLLPFKCSSGSGKNGRS